VVKESVYALRAIVFSHCSQDQLFSLVFVFNVFDHIQDCMSVENNDIESVLQAINIIDKTIRMSRELALYDRTYQRFE
jgi:hypothetical protein